MRNLLIGGTRTSWQDTALLKATFTGPNQQNDSYYTTTYVKRHTHTRNPASAHCPRLLQEHAKVENVCTASPGPKYAPETSMTCTASSAYSMGKRMPGYFDCVMASASSAAPGPVYNTERLDHKGSVTWGGDAKPVFGRCVLQCVCWHVGHSRLYSAGVYHRMCLARASYSMYGRYGLPIHYGSHIRKICIKRARHATRHLNG